MCQKEAEGIKNTQYFESRHLATYQIDEPTGRHRLDKMHAVYKICFTTRTCFGKKTHLKNHISFHHELISAALKNTASPAIQQLCGVAADFAGQL